MDMSTEPIGTFYDVAGPNESLQLFEAGLDYAAWPVEEMTDTCFRFYVNPGPGSAIDIATLYAAADALELTVMEITPGQWPEIS